jgi:hypothetical protein
VALRTNVLELVRARYADFRPTLAREKLIECHGLRVSKETLRQWMTEDGLWVPHARRRDRVHQPRRRRACLGELVQIDGCDHEWVEDRGQRCTLLVFVDDATSSLMQLLFCDAESAAHRPMLTWPMGLRSEATHGRDLISRRVTG